MGLGFVIGGALANLTDVILTGARGIGWPIPYLSSKPLPLAVINAADMAQVLGFRFCYGVASS